MKHLKLFNDTASYDTWKNGEDYVLPNVSYVEEIKGIKYDRKKSYRLRAKYNATSDNLFAFTNADNIKSLKVNGNPIKIEPIKNEITTFDVLGENISLDVNTGAATFPESYVVKSPVSSWSFKAKDPNYTINENTYVCMLGMQDGMSFASPIPLEEAMIYGITTNDGVTLEAVDTFLSDMNGQIQSGIHICFTLMDVDMNSQTLMFIDTEHQTNVTTGGLPTYSFDGEGLYDVEIELTNPVISMQFCDSSLINIEIFNGVTSIGENAFLGCTALANVRIGKSVTSIGDYAFQNCSSLTSVNIPNSVTSIGDHAFNNCSGLTGSLVIPNSVTSIGEWAFNNCSGLTGSLVIPNSVTSIGQAAFDDCSSLTEIAIPNSVTSIEYATFRNCSSLTEITIPNSVTSIGESAFSDCSALTSVTIGSGVTSIGSYALSGCSSLTDIICHATTAPSIQSYTFNNINSFGTLNVPKGSDYSSWLKTSSYYLGYYGWMEPSTPVYDFICSYDVNNISSTTKLYTDSYFKPVMMIINGEKLKASSSYKFNEIGQYEVIYRFLTPITKIEAEAFRNCSSLTSVTIPDSITNIGSNAFYNCSKLTSITIPDSVTLIGEKAFYECTSLTSVHITDIAAWCGISFNPSNLTTNPLYYAHNLYINGELVTDLVIPDSVTSIGNYAFLGCASLTSITISDSVTSIGDSAFRLCSSLTEITIPNSVTSIEKSAFYDCNSLTSITIGNGVTSIGDSAFNVCDALTSITIPNSVTSIGDSAFNGCCFTKETFINNSSLDAETNNYWGASIYDIIQEDGLCINGTIAANCRCKATSVTIPNSVTEIGYMAFAGCDSLTSITIPNSVTLIGEYAFHSCSALKSVIIGNGVTSIESYAFYRCSSLTNITCYALTAPSIQSATFSNFKSYDGTLYVPSGSDYSSWMNGNYLGQYNWTIEYI